MTSDDQAREDRISALKKQLIRARDPYEAMSIWRQLKRTIAARSSEQVERMEREKGLADGR